MKNIPFWKMSGSGNDFVVIDNRRRLLSKNIAGWARRLCDRHFGVGADGLLLLEPSRQTEFRMVYFNSDGSRARMCGNGARCIAWAAKEWGVVGQQFDFQTDAGRVQGHVAGEIVRITLSDPRDYQPALMVKATGQSYRLMFINTGVPHAVVLVSDVKKVRIAEEGRALRFHRAFGPEGANVNFVQRLNDHTLRVRTYERGVEGETLACGTGVSASAIAASLRGLVKPVVRCLTAGGDALDVDFQLHPETPKHPARQVTLKGPVRRTFAGHFENKP
ncbi:MAG: diaminopimelate epimerase [Elusimicrobiota bacterium]|jgi:diaminopimelate epimerase